MIHMGLRLRKLLDEKGLRPVELRQLVSPKLTFVKKGEVVSKQWLFELCRSEMWRPRNLHAVASSLDVDPSYFLKPMRGPQVNLRSKKG